MNYDVTGKLIAKYPVQEITDKFRKREFVLEVVDENSPNQYSNFIKMQLVQAKCELIDNYNENDMVKVHFNLRGNKWEKDGKVNYITSLDAWRIERPNVAPQGGNNQNYAQPQNFNQGGGNYNQPQGGGFNPNQGGGHNQNQGGGFNHQGQGNQGGGGFNQNQQAPQNNPNQGNNQNYQYNEAPKDDLPF